MRRRVLETESNAENVWGEVSTAQRSDGHFDALLALKKMSEQNHAVN